MPYNTPVEQRIIYNRAIDLGFSVPDARRLRSLSPGNVGQAFETGQMPPVTRVTTPRKPEAHESRAEGGSIEFKRYVYPLGDYPEPKLRRILEKHHTETPDLQLRFFTVHKVRGKEVVDRIVSTRRRPRSELDALIREALSAIQDLQASDPRPYRLEVIESEYVGGAAFRRAA